MAQNKDPYVPQFVVNKEQNIDISITGSDATLVNQGYIYNQAGFTYNQIGVEYGGIQNVLQDIIPIFADKAQFITPSISGIVDIGIPANHQKPQGPGFWLYVGE